MNKRIISLVLALVMVLSTFSSVFAAEANKDAKEPKKDEKVEKVEKVLGKDQKIQYVIDHKFVEGYEDGTYGYDKTIKRSEITKLLVYANGHEDLAKRLQGSMKIYTDVDTKHWANGVISVGSTVPSEANGLPMLIGYPDNSFKPEKDVTYAELAKMLVVLVKKDLTKEMHDNAIWASSWMTWAAQLGILDDVNVANSNDPATRADAFVMLYNALYSMKYIKRLPSNETMGILSQLKNNELTINQGKKAKTFKLTNDTVFVIYNDNNSLDVNAVKAKKNVNKFAKAVKVSAINNPSYYYGSLLRVLVNDKNEVTHILELGNPRDLALGHKDKMKWQNNSIEDYKIDPNRRWADIADATLETSSGDIIMTDCCHETQLKRVAAKINYPDSHKAKSISFWEADTLKAPVNATDGKEHFNEGDPNNFVIETYYNNEHKVAHYNATKLLDTVRLTSETRYFVADVKANQLTEVDGVEEAITILGLTRASNWFFDVYVGYDNIDGRDKREHSRNPEVQGFKEATVVVFNSVLKDNNDGQLLRARQQSTNLYDVRLEDTDGNVVVDNYKAYRNGMQFVNARTDAGKAVEVSNLDVVDITRNNAYGIDVLVKIDHSDTAKFPIVKVIDVQGRAIVVEGEGGDTASLVLDTDYDKFINKDELMGKLIQFHTISDNSIADNANDTNVIDIVSVLPANYDGGVKGYLPNVLYGNQKEQHSGYVSAIDLVENGSKPYEIKVHDYRNLYDTDQGQSLHIYVINKTEWDALKFYLEANGYTADGNRDEIRFKLRKGVDSTLEAYDVEVYEGEVWKLALTYIPETAAVYADFKAKFDVEWDKYFATTDSVDGTDVKTDKYWAPAADNAKFKKVLDELKAIYNNSDLSKAKYKKAMDDLEKAAIEYDQVRKLGTQP